MKVKISAVQESLPALGALAGVKLPAQVSFKVALLVKALKDPIEAFNDVRKKLLEDPAVAEPMKLTDKDGKEVLDEEGKPRFKEGEYTIKDPKRWNDEMKAAGDQEIEVNVEAIKVSELGAAEIEPRVLVALDWCIVQ